MKKPMNSFVVDRRKFLISSLSAGAGLAIGFSFFTCGGKKGGSGSGNGNIIIPNDIANPVQCSGYALNAWIKIGTDNCVSVVVPQAEMGQGVMTSIPMIVAEELDADWPMVSYEQAPVDPVFGDQKTESSLSIRDAWSSAREAAAIGKKMLITVAASRWNVPESECITEKSTVIHSSTARKLNYGDLVEAAAALPIPESASLKDASEYRIIGQPLSHLDSPIKLTGEAVFGIDVTLPDMLIATVAHCPVFGGTLVDFDDTQTKAIAGVKYVLALDYMWLRSAVAVVATSYWAAKKGLDVLSINWDLGNNATISSQTISDELRLALDGSAQLINEYGDSALLQAGSPIEAEYEVPYQAHATMEPMNCTAFVQSDRCDIWAPTQAPTLAKKTAVELLSDMAPDNIFIHTTFLGGGFGRRLEPDFISEAVQISIETKTPIKLIWSRKEDIQHDFYRPAVMHRLKAATSGTPNAFAWHHRIAGPERWASSAGADSVPYNFDYLRIDFVDTPTHVPLGAWRSVGNSHNAFAVESFIDEIAHSKQQDPYQFRLDLLVDRPRHSRVLELAAQNANWGNPAAGRYQGIALWAAYGSFIAQIAEISVTGQEIKVHRVVCAIDCGIVINPDTVKAQMQSAIVYGLSAALKGKIDISNGAVVQSNFHNFPILSIDEMPMIDTYIESNSQWPGGVGEPGLPPIAPALANAVYAATGQRIRKLPIILTV